MHQLDQVGRFVPSTLDVSRAAADRHALDSALRERNAARTRSLPRLRRRPREWIHVLVASLS